jgi:hypothetical protein
MMRRRLESLKDLEKQLHKGHRRFTVETSTPPVYRAARRAWWKLTVFVLTHALAAAAGIAGAAIAEQCARHVEATPAPPLLKP